MHVSTLTRRRSLTSTLAAGAAGILLLTACGKDASDVSQSKLESKLKQDSDVSSVLSSVPASKKDAAISCIAKSMRKDADGDDLQDYADGKKSINDIKGDDSDSDDSFKSHLSSCFKAATGG